MESYCIWESTLRETRPPRRRRRRPRTRTRGSGRGRSSRTGRRPWTRRTSRSSPRSRRRGRWRGVARGPVSTSYRGKWLVSIPRSFIDISCHFVADFFLCVGVCVGRGVWVSNFWHLQRLKHLPNIWFQFERPWLASKRFDAAAENFSGRRETLVHVDRFDMSGVVGLVLPHGNVSALIRDSL